MALNEQAIEFERQVRQGKALQYAGALVEELRMLQVLGDPDDSEQVSQVERMHDDANNLAGRIKHYGLERS